MSLCTVCLCGWDLAHVAAAAAAADTRVEQQSEK